MAGAPMLVQQAHKFSQVTSHRDHLFAHMKHDFGALEIHAHFFDQETSHAHAIDLIERIQLSVLTDNRADHTLTLETFDKRLIDAADFNYFSDSKILTRHAD